jgi:hypothetical protein
VPSGSLQNDRRQFNNSEMPYRRAVDEIARANSLHALRDDLDFSSSA